jgi:hypothetical protein
LAYQCEEYQTLVAVADITASELETILIIHKEWCTGNRTFKVDVKTIMFAIGRADF